jgi:hypothetical protein
MAEDDDDDGIYSTETFSIVGDTSLTADLMAAGLGPAPVGHLMRGHDGGRWVRFHFFEGKRYPENSEDDENVFSLFKRVGSCLFSQGQTVRICDWGYWMDVEDEDREVFRIRSRVALWEPFGWRERVLDTAHFETGFTIICPQTLAAIAPYDGGIDVFARDSSERDILRLRFADRLSPRSDGL